VAYGKFIQINNEDQCKVGLRTKAASQSAKTPNSWKKKQFTVKEINLSKTEVANEMTKGKTNRSITEVANGQWGGGGGRTSQNKKN